MAAAKKPKVEYYWSPKSVPIGVRLGPHPPPPDFEVNVRIIAANGTQVGQITQGSQDKRDARRCVAALLLALDPLNCADIDEAIWNIQHSLVVREVGPGPKPKVGKP